MTSLYGSLTLKLANVVELATQDQGTNLTPQAKQTLVRAVSTPDLAAPCIQLTLRPQQTREYKDSVKDAIGYATSLPGGELSVEEQDEVIEMLEKLKERKRCVNKLLQSVHVFTIAWSRKQLAEFADRVGNISSSQANLKMEVDSISSTPA